MKRGEVWWVEFDPAVGSEIRKTRPVVIVSNDAANRNLARLVVVPLTSNASRQYPGVSISVQYFPPFSVQYFPLFQPADACLCAA